MYAVAGETIRIPFTTSRRGFGVEAPSVAGTLTVRKDGTNLVAPAGVSIAGASGVYEAVLATGSNPTDFVAGSWYQVFYLGAEIGDETIVGGLIGSFLLKPAPANLVQVAGSATDVAALATSVALILADTNELQLDWQNGGRLDLLVDAIKAKTDVITNDPATETTLTAIAATLALVKAVTDLLPNGGALDDLATLEARLTAARAALLDKLSITGNVASQADVAATLQASRVRVSVPQWLERPDSGSATYRVWIYVYDAQHLAEDLDDVPVVTAANASGTDRSANLGAVTKPGSTTGIYFVDYTVADAHVLEQLSFDVAATEGAVTTRYPASTIVVDYTQSAFTPTDRSDLQAAKASAATAATQSTNGASSAASAVTKIDATKAVSDLIHAKTTNLPASPAAVGSQMDLIDAPNATAVTALQQGLATSTALSTVSNKIGTPAGASLAEDIAAVPTSQENADAAADEIEQADRIGGKLGTMIELDGAGPAYQFKAAAVDQAPAGGGGGGSGDATAENQATIIQKIDAVDAKVSLLGAVALTGPNEVTVTVKSASTGLAIEGAVVSLIKDAARDPKRTLAAGVTVHTIEDGETWTIRVLHPRFIGQSRSLSVAGGESVAELFELETLSIDPPDSPDKITGVLLCLDENEDPKPGVIVTVEITQASTLPGVGHDGVTTRQRTSGPSGHVQFPHAKGAVYRHRVGSGAWTPYRAPSTGTSFNMPEAVSG